MLLYRRYAKEIGREQKVNSMALTAEMLRYIRKEVQVLGSRKFHSAVCSSGKFSPIKCAQERAKASTSLQRIKMRQHLLTVLNAETAECLLLCTCQAGNTEEEGTGRPVPSHPNNVASVECSSTNGTRRRQQHSGLYATGMDQSSMSERRNAAPVTPGILLPGVHRRTV